MTTMTRRTGTVRKVAHDPGDPLVTSHCPFCGSGQVVGRSDGTIGCDFCGQNYIVRVQPAFPGMPQMPMGPGAPSDVGPDGGLVDPGMIGPDGAPMDGPPGEDAEPGGPQDESPDGEGDFPPPGDGGDDDATGSKPPKKGDSGKSKSKKESSRRYRGLEGQSLTEDQLVRHVAVRASGADPAVMRLLRATSRLVTADDGAPLPYRTLGSGHRVTVGRNSAGWYGQISPPAPHTQAHYMDLGYAGTREDAHMLADLHLQRGPARDFVRSTTSDLGQPGQPVSRGTGSEWYRQPGTGGARQEWRPAQASRGRRPFARGAHQEPLRDLASLRAHMSGEHGLDVSGMLPLRVLLSLHGKDHAGHEDTWNGSADSSRAPGFVAVRRTAADGPGWWDDLIPGDRITGRVQGERLRAMREHMRGLGFPVQDTDSHGYENLGPSFTIPDTGHHVSIGHSRKNETWVANIHHPEDHLMSGEKTTIGINLGLNAEHVPHLLAREMGSQPVIGEMRRQWARANSGADYGERPPGGWRKPDGKRPYPKHVNFTARGATLPRDDEDYY